MGEAIQKKSRNYKEGMMFSYDELSLMKNTFAKSDELLFTIRKFFLQFPLTEKERETIYEMSDDLIALLKKTIDPDLNPEAPLFQLGDGWTGIPIKDRMSEQILLDMNAKFIANQYLKERFEVLKTKQEGGISLDSLLPDDMKSLETAIPELYARNWILGFVDYSLNRFKILAGLESETVEETLARNAKNSNK